MHILISGGTGFIGQQLIRSFLADDHSVSVFVRDKEKALAQFGTDVTLIGDLEGIPDDTMIDVIVNLAGEPIARQRWSSRRKTALIGSRVGVTRGLVNLVARLDKKPACFISGSAVGFYGDQGTAVVTETTQPHVEFSHLLCSDWEQEATNILDHQVRLCILRTGLVVGAKGGFLKQMLLPFKLGVGGRLGRGEQWMSWIHMDDIISLIRWFISEPTCEGVYNGSAPTPVTNSEFTKVLGNVLHRPTVFPVPAFVLKLLMGEMSQLLLTGQKAIPQRALDAGYEFRYPTLRPALEEALG